MAPMKAKMTALTMALNSNPAKSVAMHFGLIHSCATLTTSRE